MVSEFKDFEVKNQGSFISITPSVGFGKTVVLHCLLQIAYLLGLSLGMIHKKYT